ncbi:MAG: ABC transporter transmembrane domain-containing protein, partial [Halothece sp. Uz-M2-17]|nr:ABC transporter transmembrane domain-containing protein [Halothece sp. Uz-M2-17]
MSTFISQFFHILRERKLILVGMVGLFFLTSLLELIGIGLVGSFVSIVTHPNQITDYQLLSRLYNFLNLTSEQQLVAIISSILIVIFYVKAYLAFRAQQWIFQFGFNQQQILASRLMKIYLNAPYAFHLQRNSAFIVQNIVDETQKFCNGFMMPLLTFTSNLLVTTALVIFLITRNASACLVIAGLMTIALLLFQKLKHRLTAWGKQSSVSRSEMIRTINEGLAGLKENRVIGCESYFQKRLENSAKEYSTSMALALSYSNLPRFVIEAFLITFLVLFTLITVLIAGNNTNNLTSTLSIFALASIRLMPVASGLTNSLNSMRNS